ncbi:MAG: dUTP diphosphatase [Actinobacteria bacterium]|nr:dUTP diphosphatase [Actinomycetota bacterium]
MEQVDVKVTRLAADVPLPTYAHPGDAGLDLSASEPLVLGPGERGACPTGIAVAIPPGWVGLVHPRSGRAIREGLTLINAPGTIDAGYRGEVKVLLVNLGAEEVRIERGDRVAQLLLQRVAQARLVEVDELPRSERGAGGFGSSGA